MAQRRLVSLLLRSALVLLSSSVLAAGAEGRVAACLLDLKQVAVWDAGGTLVARIPVGAGPRGLAWRDGRLFVANRGEDKSPGSTISIIRSDTLEVLEQPEVCAGCAPRGLTFDSRGVLWITGQAHQAVYKVEPPYREPAASVVVSWGWPTEIALGPGPLLTVGFRGGQAVALIDPVAFRSTRLDLGPVPEVLAARPGSGEVWAAMNPAGQIAVLRDTSSGPSAERWTGPAFPQDLAFTADGNRLLVTAGSAQALIVFDATTRRETGRLVFDSPPREIAVAPGGGRAVVHLPENKQLVFVTLSGEGRVVREKSVSVPGVISDLLWIP